MLKKAFCKFIISSVFLLFLAMLSVLQGVKAQKFETLLEFQNLKDLQGEEFRERVAELRDSLSSISDYNTSQYYLNKLFSITSQKDEIAHIHMLIWKAGSGDSAYPQLFEQAYKIAEKHNRPDDMCLVEYTRGQFYIAKRQYDSAMIHILRYRDMTPESEKGEGYRNIINMMGDIYFHAGLYEQARLVYLNMHKQYAEEENWNFYRPYVMMNNLGQIALKTGDTEQAEEWFNKSLQKAEQNLHTYYRNNTLAYTRIKLAETALMTDSITKAENFLKEVENLAPGSVFEDVLQEYLYVKSQLLIKQHKLTEAYDMANRLIPGDSVKFSEYRFIPEIYKLQSEIACQQKNFPLALELKKKYEEIADSIKRQENVAQSMIILANRDHEITRSELRRSKIRNLNLAIGLGFLLIIVIILLYLYRRLYYSKLKLVRKSLEQSTTVESNGMPASINPENEAVNDTDIQEQKQLIIKLKNIMETHKVFLNPGLSLEQTAKELSTNRTYLSRAINNQLNTTFPNFLNEYRIREAIKMIRMGYTTNHTQDALARQSGFASRTVFISAFKKHTGVVPSFFIANYRKMEEWE